MTNNVANVGVPLVGTQNDTHKKGNHVVQKGNHKGLKREGNHKGLKREGNHKGLPLRNYDRRSLRLKHYDYSSMGYYFITICTQGKECLFGEITDGKMILNGAGNMIHTLWYEIMVDFPNVHLHEFVIMPNHIHGIIEIVDYENDFDTVGVPLVGTLQCDKHTKGNHKGLPLRENDNLKMEITLRAPIKGAPTVGDVVGAFKSKTTNTYIKMVKNSTLPPFRKRIWQRNYHEHIIRDDVDYERVATYTINNPLTWEDDVLSNP